MLSEENRSPVELFFRITGSVIAVVVALWPQKRNEMTKPGSQPSPVVWIMLVASLTGTVVAIVVGRRFSALWHFALLGVVLGTLCGVAAWLA